jgi:hypothetical protein
MTKFPWCVLIRAGAVTADGAFPLSSIARVDAVDLKDSPALFSSAEKAIEAAAALDAEYSVHRAPSPEELLSLLWLLCMNDCERVALDPRNAGERFTSLPIGDMIRQVEGWIAHA